ncbi:MAG: site-specific integrase [Chloroflexi bacterium]|nr:site-specific integrase [Chloroflexota bacterium]
MTRRGAQEGSIYRRADGLWVGAVHLGYRDGKRRRKAVYGKTRREVQEQVTVTLRAVQQGLPVPTERQTVDQYLSAWLVTARTALRPRTHESYADTVRLHIIPTLGGEQLAKLSPGQVQALLDAKLAGGLSPRTVQYIHAILRRALGQAYRWGIVPRNVASVVTPPRVPRVEVRPFDPDQARAFLSAMRGDRLEALYTVAIAVGLRQGEALGLRWRDVDLEAGSLRVCHSLQRIEGKLQLVEPKTARSRRTVSLPGVVVTALREHRVRQLQEHLLAGSRWQVSDQVFTSTIGTPLDGVTVTHRFQDTLRRLGMPHQRFHDLRHACASLLLAQGVSPRVVMETLGHSQISVTMNVYSHVIPALQRDAADRMDALLSSSGRV